MPGDSRDLPVTVLGGYLGAGKTTLLNHLLRHAGGRRIAVLVNDFGEIAIDAALIESRDGDVLSLAGGCVCCSIGSDLVGALRGVVGRRPEVDHVVIETSGVALPHAVAAAITLVPGAAVDAIVVVADAATVRARARDRYVGDVVTAQLAAADLLVVASRDLVDDAEAASLGGWLKTVGKDAPIVEAVRGAVPPEVIVGMPGRARTPAQPAISPAAAASPRPLSIAGTDPIRLGARPGTAADQRFAQASRRLDCRHDPHRLAAALAAPALGLLRAKAIVRDGRGVAHVVQLAGARCEVAPLGPAASREDDRSFGLIGIGLRDRLDEAGIDAALAASRL